MSNSKKTKAELHTESESLKARIRKLEKKEREMLRTIEALSLGEERYRVVFEQAADAIVLIDAETGAILEFNQKAHEQLGYTREEFRKIEVANIEALESAKDFQAHVDKIKEIGADTFETKHKTKSGEIRDVLVNCRVVSVGDKKFFQSIWIDITGRKRAVEALKASEERYRTLIEQAQEVIYTLEPGTGTITSVNSYVETMLGYRQKDFQNKMHFLDMVHPDDRERVRNRMHAVIMGEPRQQDYPFRVRKADNTYIDVESNGTVVRDSSNNPYMFIGLIRDVTERRKMEESLRLSEKRYQAMLDSSHDMISVMDASGKIVYANRAWLKNSLYTIDEVNEIGIFQTMHPEGRSGARKTFEELKDGKIARNFEFRVIGKDRNIKWRQANVDPVYWPGLGKAYLNIIRDISERKHAEEQLQESEERYRTLVENMPDRVLLLDNEGKILYINVVTDFASKDEVIGRQATSFMQPESTKIYAEALKRTVKKKVISELEIVSVFDRHYRVRLISVGDHVMSVGTDITDRKHAQEMLRESDERYRTLFEESHDAIFVTTLEGKIVDMNPAGVKLFGYSSREELLGTDIPRDSYWNPDDRKALQREIAKQGFVADYELNLKNNAGERLIVLVTANAVRDEEGNIVMYRGIMHDITKRRQLQSQLQRASRLAAIGELAAGVAHEVNNPIAAIDVHTGLVREILDDEKEELPQSLRDSLESYLHIVEEQVQRCQSVTGQLLSFVRVPRQNQDAVDVNELLKRTLKLTASLSEKHPQLEMILAEKLPPLHCDPHQLQQVFINLFNNAVKAIQSGDEIAVSTHLTDDGAIGIEIRDSGCGMPLEIQERIFDPFFTGGSEVEGTGLGLSISHYIVKQLDGRIEVKSSPGQGSTFTVILPVVDGMMGGPPRD